MASKGGVDRKDDAERTNDGIHSSNDQKQGLGDTALADAAAQEKVNPLSKGMLAVRDRSLVGKDQGDI
jgi:hypothetical protein